MPARQSPQAKSNPDAAVASVLQDRAVKRSKSLTQMDRDLDQLAVLRLERDRAAAELKAADEAYDQLAAKVLNAMLDAGIETTGNANGVVSVKRTETFQATDWQALDAYILKTGSIDLLNRRLTVKAVRERVEQGEKVPGVVPFTKIELSWTTRSGEVKK